MQLAAGGAYIGGWNLNRGGRLVLPPPSSIAVSTTWAVGISSLPKSALKIAAPCVYVMSFMTYIKMSRKTWYIINEDFFKLKIIHLSHNKCIPYRHKVHWENIKEKQQWRHKRTGSQGEWRTETIHDGHWASYRSWFVLKTSFGVSQTSIFHGWFTRCMNIYGYLLYIRKYLHTF